MAVSVPIQQNLTTRSDAGTFASSGAEDRPADTFGALLSWLSNGKSSLESGPSVVAPPNAPPAQDVAQPNRPSLSPAESRSELSLKGRAQVESKDAIKSNSVETATKLPVHDAAESKVPADVRTSKTLSEVTGLPRGSSLFPMDGSNARTRKTEAGSGETISSETPGTATKSPTNEISSVMPRAHGKTSKMFSDKTAPSGPLSASQNSPGIILTAIGLLSQTSAIQVRSQPTMSMPSSALSTSVAAAPQLRTDNTRKTAEPLPVGPPPVRDEQSSRLDPSQQAASPTPSSGGDALSDKVTVRSEAVPETAALTFQSDGPQAAFSGTETLSPARLDQNQPVPAAERTMPSDQIAPALVGMLKTTDGVQSVTIRLQPVELGDVQIRVDRTADGPDHVEITTERPETLQLLQRDQPRLEQALDQAGLFSTGRTVSFQLAVPEQIGAGAFRADNTTAGSSDSGQGQGGGAWRQGSDSHGDADGGPDTDQQQAHARWFRAGLDITA